MTRDLPLGEKVDWKRAQPPRRRSLRGEHVLLRAFDPAPDAQQLFAVSHPPDGDPSIWTYLPDGPYRSAEQLRDTLAFASGSLDPFHFAIVPEAHARPLGQAAYLRIAPDSGSIEIGHIWFARELQRTTAATEAIFLLLSHAFDELRYRRVEWKCDALNAASRRAAERFGFTFEGVFRKHLVIKGRNRDTAWFSIVDEEWPAVRAGFERWLAPESFDRGGAQLRPLSELIAGARERSG